MKKIVKQRKARKIARHEAGAALQAMIRGGWSPPHLVRRYGSEGVDEIRKGLAYYAEWLIVTGHPDGSGIVDRNLSS